MLKIARSMRINSQGARVKLPLAEQCFNDVLFLLGDYYQFISIVELDEDPEHYGIKLAASVSDLIALYGYEPSPATAVALLTESQFDVYIYAMVLPATIYYQETRSPPPYDVTIPVGGGDPGNTSAGETFYPQELIADSIGNLLTGSSAFAIVYDAEPRQDKYSTLGVNDAGSQVAVCMSNITTLYHELMHAVVGIQGITDPFQSHKLVWKYENDLRSFLGMHARLENGDGRTAYGTAQECFQSASQPGSTVPSEFSWCLIVSAASCDQDKHLLQGLRNIRDNVLRRSALGVEFFDCLLWQYYAVSPQISQSLRSNPSQRMIARRAVVLPFLEFMMYVAFGTPPDWNLSYLDRRFLREVTCTRSMCGISLPSSQILSWALLDPLKITLKCVQEGRGHAEGLRGHVEQWKFSIPAVAGMSSLSSGELKADTAWQTFFSGFPEIELLTRGQILSRSPEAFGRSHNPLIHVSEVSVRSDGASTTIGLLVTNISNRWIYVPRFARMESESTIVVGAIDVHAPEFGHLLMSMECHSISQGTGARLTFSIKRHTPGPEATVSVRVLDYPYYNVLDSHLSRDRCSPIADTVAVKTHVALVKSHQLKGPSASDRSRR